jgi:hypothetical protein
VGDAAERRLDAAEHDGHAREGLAAEVRVDDGGPVGPGPARPPGEYWSSLRTFFWAVSLLSIESRLPAVIPTIRRGAPMRSRSAVSFHEGWAIIPTRNPRASRKRPISAAPNAGWST